MTQLDGLFWCYFWTFSLRLFVCENIFSVAWERKVLVSMSVAYVINWIKIGGLVHIATMSIFYLILL